MESEKVLRVALLLAAATAYSAESEPLGTRAMANDLTNIKLNFEKRTSRQE